MDSVNAEEERKRQARDRPSKTRSVHPASGPTCAEVNQEATTQQEAHQIISHDVAKQTVIEAVQCDDKAEDKLRAPTGLKLQSFVADHKSSAPSSGRQTYFDSSGSITSSFAQMDTNAKMSHVNMMADTIVSSLPEQGLRSVMRSMLASDPSITTLFEERARDYLRKNDTQIDAIFEQASGLVRTTRRFQIAQQKCRVMLGCGMCWESIEILISFISQYRELKTKAEVAEGTFQALCSIDGDIIQALTAVQKTLLTSTGSRALSAQEHHDLIALRDALARCRDACTKTTMGYPFERSSAAVGTLLGQPGIDARTSSNHEATIDVQPLSSSIETFNLGGKVLPRLFSGLWQLSSPSWGVASLSQIQEQFRQYATSGFTAYDMADHYGDAEVVFGKFRASCLNPDAIFGATKYCIFTPTVITPEVIRANVTERCQRMASDHVDLLQFHWQFYDDPQYLKALQYLHEDDRVRMLGLCNFDTQRMKDVLEAGISICTNQVQFSLIDSRPTYRMGTVCEQYNVKLLTYGTLCGGWISEKWLGKDDPELFGKDITPSQRKYYEMIVNWGGWSLFQDLLATLKSIATKHHVSISNVATRWVLDFSYVGAVIVGTRMGVSGHAEENLASYGWRLDEDDQKSIESVLVKSRRDKLIDLLGDCGGEYR